MTSPPATGKRRSLMNTPSSEDQQLNIIAQEAESRLASSHAVLVEARQIRSTERERLRRATDESEEMPDDGLPKPTSPTTPVSPVATLVSRATPVSPVTTPVLTPVSLPVVTTSVSPVATPVSLAVATSVSPVATPVSSPVATPVSTLVSSPVATPVSTLVSSPVATPVSMPVSLPVATPVSPVVTSVSTPVSNACVPSKRSTTTDAVVNGVPVKSRAPLTTVTSSTDMDDKYRQVMMTNAQLDNDKQKLLYEVDLLKDRVADTEEHNTQLEVQLARVSRELTEKNSLLSESEMKRQNVQAALSHTQALITEQGMLYVSAGDMVPADDTISAGSQMSALLPSELTQHLDVYDGSLGERLKNFFEEKLHFQFENKRLQHELELEKSRASLGSKFPQSSDNSLTCGIPGSAADPLDVESQKNITEYKWKLKRAEQEITTLQGAVTRLESQVTRYKSAAEDAEKAEEELKLEKRRLLKELRESQTLVQELETKNSHLMKRLEKSKYRNVNDSN